MENHSEMNSSKYIATLKGFSFMYLVVNHKYTEYGMLLNVYIIILYNSNNHSSCRSICRITDAASVIPYFIFAVKHVHLSLLARS